MTSGNFGLILVIAGRLTTFLGTNQTYIKIASANNTENTPSQKVITAIATAIYYMIREPSESIVR